MDNSPEAVKGRVRSMTKSIRYKARKEGNLMKAFNDYMGSQSGISATERSAVKSSLGLSENKWRTPKSDWRAEINEVVGNEANGKTIKERKVKNKIVINPVVGMKEAFEALGGEIIEMVEEVEVDEAMSPKEIQLQKRRSQIDMQIARDRRREIAKASTESGKEAPTKSVGEGYGMGEIDQKVGAVTPIPKREQDAAKARLLAKAKAKREARMKEGLDNDTKKSMDEFFRKAFNAKIPHSLQEREETEDSLRDRRMERGGVDGNVDYKRPPAKPNTFGKKPSDPKAKQRAVDRVRDDIIKRYGKGALISTKKK